MNATKFEIFNKFAYYNKRKLSIAMSSEAQLLNMKLLLSLLYMQL